MTSRFIELVYFKTYADLRSEASRTYLSFLWWIFEPLLSMVVYFVAFGLLLERGREDFIPFLLIGLTTWNWFGYTIRHGMPSIQQNRAIMNQVHLPKVVFPFIVIFTDSIKFFIVFVILLLFLWIYGFSVNMSYFALPIILLTHLTIIIAATLFLAAIVPFLPDLKFLIEALLTMLFFVSGVLFDGTSIPDQYQSYFYLNPMTHIIESYRDILMYGEWPQLKTLLGIFVCASVIVYIGYSIIKYFDYVYPRTTL
jgi:lipopolysaccharide transport system permease protein